MTDDDQVKRGYKAPKGECSYCDRMRQTKDDMHAPHNATQWCQSGKRNHCTCDKCF